MSFECPQCHQSESLAIEVSMQLYRGRCSNELTLQVVECRECKFAALAVYEEGRREALDTRAWKHIGYKVNPGSLANIRQTIIDCPDRLNPDCGCLAHLTLSACDARGKWVGLEKFEPLTRFPMRLNS